jgi:hypothetical protein
VGNSPLNFIDPMGLMKEFDTPEKIRKQTNTTIRDPDPSVGDLDISTSTVGDPVIGVGQKVPTGAQKTAMVDYHETVGIIGLEINGFGEGSSKNPTAGPAGYFPPPWEEAEAEQNKAEYNKPKFGYEEQGSNVTGWHNLAMMAELAAYTQLAKPEDQSPAEYAKGRWSNIPVQPFEGAHVSPPGKPEVPWQEDLREMIRWMREAESKGTDKPFKFVYDTKVVTGAHWGWPDKLRFRLEIELVCVGKRVKTKTLELKYWD